MPRIDALSRETIESHREVLGEFQYAALMRRDVDAAPYGAIAEALGCQVGTVKSRLNRARLKIRIATDRHPNGAPRWSPSGTLLDAKGNRSNVDQ